MGARVKALLLVAPAVTLVLILVATGSFRVTAAPTVTTQLDPIRFLKRFQDVPGEASTPSKSTKSSKGKKGKKSSKSSGGGNPDPGPVGPNVIFAVDTSVRMEYDTLGNYYDLGLWPRGTCESGGPSKSKKSKKSASTGCGGSTGKAKKSKKSAGGGSSTAVADSLGVAGSASYYRRIYNGLVDEISGFPIEASSISVVDDQDANFDAFFQFTRLGLARDGLAQVVDENQAIVRFGLIRSRYGNNAVLPATGNKSPVDLTTSPQNALPGDLGTQQWQVTLAQTTSSNDGAAASGNEVLVAADSADSSALTRARLLLDPDEIDGLMPAGLGYDDSDDSPVGNLLLDTRAEVVRLMTDDLAVYRECRNTAVVLVVGGSGGDNDPTVIASTFAAVAAGGETRRVPIFVIAVAPPAADIATLQAIATLSGGSYFQVNDDAREIARAANYAVSAVHARADDLDSGVPSVFQTTSPIVGTVDLTNAHDINGVLLPNSAVTSSSGARISEKSNVVLTAGFALPGFYGDLRAYRTYRPVADPTKPLGYRFVADGTPLWKAQTPSTAPRNLFTCVPGTGLVSFTSDSANVTLLRDYLRASSYQEAAALIDFVRAQPLGAIVDSTPAIMDAPSLGLVDAAYTTFENQHAGRRSLVFYGGNDGIFHAVDGRLGVEVWGFIPFNLLPKLATLLDGQPVGCFDYFVDSSPKVADVETAAGWRTIVVVGEGPGGTFYQAFDATEAGLTVPSDSDDEAVVVGAFADATVMPFSWSFPSYASFDHTIATAPTPWGDIAAAASQLEKTVGNAWSAPSIGQIEDASGPYVVMTGSGYLAQSVEEQAHRGSVRAGTTFYLLDVDTGTVHDSFDVGDESGKDHLKNALQADPTAVGPASSRFIDKAYIGDTEGNLWRFDTFDRQKRPRLGGGSPRCPSRSGNTTPAWSNRSMARWRPTTLEEQPSMCI